MNKKILITLACITLIGCHKLEKQGWLREPDAYKHVKQGEVLRMPERLSHVQRVDYFPIPALKTQQNDVSLLPPDSPSTRIATQAKEAKHAKTK